MNNDLISIIMATYNPKNTEALYKSVNSILNQTHKNIEFLICDDGSNSATKTLLEEIQQLDDRIICIANESNMGLAASLNHCLSIAKGDFIARQDDDDISFLNRLELELDFLKKNTEYGFVGSSVELFNDQGVWGKSSPIIKPEPKDFLVRSPFAHPTILVRRSAYEKVNGYRVSKETMRAQDYDLFMRMYAKDIRGYNISECLYKYYQSNHSFNKIKFKYKIGEFFIRIRGFSMMGILYPKGILACFKPIIVGIVPHCIKLKLHEMKYGGGL